MNVNVILNLPAENFNRSRILNTTNLKRPYTVSLLLKPWKEHHHPAQNYLAKFETAGKEKLPAEFPSFPYQIFMAWGLITPTFSSFEASVFSIVLNL